MFGVYKTDIGNRKSIGVAFVACGIVVTGMDRVDNPKLPSGYD
jgi:hypothetical protein